MPWRLVHFDGSCQGSDEDDAAAASACRQLANNAGAVLEMSGHSSPTPSDQARGRHPEYFLETFPAANSFMVRANDISAVSDRDSLDIASLVEMNPKEFVERLTRIRDNKRNVLEAMGKLKNKFDGDMDKSKLQRLVGLYDDLKKQEDEYLCIFRSVFPGKHGSMDSIPGATAASGSGAASSPTGSTGSRKDGSLAQGAKKGLWNPAVSSADDSAIYELQEAQDALVRMLDQHKALKGMEAAPAPRPCLDKTDLNRQRESLQAKQQELDRLRAKLDSYKLFCGEGANQVTSDAYDEETVQERLQALQDRRQHMESLLHQLHRFEEDLGQDIIVPPRAEPSAPSVNSPFDSAADSNEAHTGTTDGKRKLESQIQTQMQIIQQLKAEHARLLALRNEVLMLNGGAAGGGGSVGDVRELNNGRASPLNGGGGGGSKARPYFLPSMASSAAASDDDDSFEHLDDLSEPLGDRYFHSGSGRGYTVAPGGSLRGKRQQLQPPPPPQKQHLAYVASSAAATEGVQRKVSVSNFSGSSVEQQYQQLQQHINSIRAIFKEVALVGVSDEPNLARQPCSCGGAAATPYRDPVNGQQQQALMLAVLTCQQQIQIQQMELASLRSWFQSVLDDGSKEEWPNRVWSGSSRTFPRRSYAEETVHRRPADGVGRDAELQKIWDSIDREVSTLVELNKQRPEHLVHLLRQLQSRCSVDSTISSSRAKVTQRDDEEALSAKQRPAAAPVSSDNERQSFNEPDMVAHPGASLDGRVRVSQTKRMARCSGDNIRQEDDAVTLARSLCEEALQLVINGTDGDRAMVLDDMGRACLRDALMLRSAGYLAERYRSGEAALLSSLDTVLCDFADQSLASCWSTLSQRLQQVLNNALDDGRMVAAAGRRREEFALQSTMVESIAVHLMQPESKDHCDTICEDLNRETFATTLQAVEVSTEHEQQRQEDEESVLCAQPSVPHCGASVDWLKVVKEENDSGDPVKFIEHDNQEYSSVTIDYKAVHPNRVKCMNTVTVHVPNELECVKKVIHYGGE